MTVAELIAELQRYDPSRVVVVGAEYSGEYGYDTPRGASPCTVYRRRAREGWQSEYAEEANGGDLTLAVVLQ